MSLMRQVIETTRLKLLPWRLSDSNDVLAYAQDEEWSKYLLMLPRPYTRRHAEEFVARQVLLDAATHPSWAIVLKGVVVGGINVRLEFGGRVGEIGYSIARAHWNQGYVTEAVRAVLDEAFRGSPQLSRIRAFADARNTASQRVMKKLGMKKEGLLRRNRLERDVLLDEVWFGILREEWDYL